MRCCCDNACRDLPICLVVIPAIFVSLCYWAFWLNASWLRIREVTLDYRASLHRASQALLTPQIQPPTPPGPGYGQTMRVSRRLPPTRTIEPKFRLSEPPAGWKPGRDALSRLYAEMRTASGAPATEKGKLARVRKAHDPNDAILRRKPPAIRRRPAAAAARPAHSDTLITAIQSNLQATLISARGGGRSRCSQKIPIFVARLRRNYNFGDELGLDVIGAILGLNPRCGGGEPSCDEPTVTFTTNNSRQGKLLLIGSTLRCARPSDVVFGAGIKPPITAELLAALRNSRVSVVGVRGPRTCAALRGSEHYYPPSCPFYGDPALYSHLLIPSWHDLRHTPQGATGGGATGDAAPAGGSAPRLLCSISHAFDASMGAHAWRLAKRQAAALENWEAKCDNVSTPQRQNNLTTGVEAGYAAASDQGYYHHELAQSAIARLLALGPTSKPPPPSPPVAATGNSSEAPLCSSLVDLRRSTGLLRRHKSSEIGLLCQFLGTSELCHRHRVGNVVCRMLPGARPESAGSCRPDHVGSKCRVQPKADRSSAGGGGGAASESADDVRMGRGAHATTAELLGRDSKPVTYAPECVAQLGRPPTQVRLISTRQRIPKTVAKRLLDCDLVVSSALHGVVLSDALRIPSVWLSAYTGAEQRSGSPASAADVAAGVLSGAAAAATAVGSSSSSSSTGYSLASLRGSAEVFGGNSASARYMTAAGYAAGYSAGYAAATGTAATPPSLSPSPGMHDGGHGGAARDGAARADLASTREGGLSTSAHPFKFLDYFAGVGRTPQSVGTIEEALAMLDERASPPEPRFSITELMRLATRFVKAFPFRRVARCARSSSNVSVTVSNSA